MDREVQPEAGWRVQVINDRPGAWSGFFAPACEVRHSAGALWILAEIADDPNADPAVREEARQALEKWLVRLKELGQDSTLSPDVRRELEDTIRKFRHS